MAPAVGMVVRKGGKGTVRLNVCEVRVDNGWEWCVPTMDVVERCPSPLRRCEVCPLSMVVRHSGPVPQSGTVCSLYSFSCRVV